MIFDICSAHGNGVVGHVEDAVDERDALGQYIRSLSYEPDFADAYQWRSRLLVPVENDELFAIQQHPTNPHGVLVPCSNCGREIHIPRTELVEDHGAITCSVACRDAFVEATS